MNISVTTFILVAVQNVLTLVHTENNLPRHAWIVLCDPIDVTYHADIWSHVIKHQLITVRISTISFTDGSTVFLSAYCNHVIMVE